MAGLQEINGRALLRRVDDPNFQEEESDTDESETSDDDDDDQTLYLCKICRVIVQPKDKDEHRDLHKGETNVGKGRGL